MTSFEADHLAEQVRKLGLPRCRIWVLRRRRRAILPAAPTVFGRLPQSIICVHGSARDSN